ncbi:MAG: hypothetical protein A2W28_03190 [Gammaproteobacteria bacterium RBG_16_51_14]|nr:MAG: hypothetical protein A2W28_03190 [Gammaproteobacteria bacterium RBG_16_51_14]
MPLLVRRIFTNNSTSNYIIIQIVHNQLKTIAMNPANIPTRKGVHGEEIETRPLQVEEWLESLPYIDSVKTCALLQEALQATNKQQVTSSTRLELVELYNWPYQYYIDSQVKTGAQHTPQSTDTMLHQVQSLKQIAVQLSFSCKLAVEEVLNRKTLWKQGKPPLQPMLMSLNYLSHALIFSFLEYAPTPKKVWSELNLIYSFAEGLGQQKTTLELPGHKAKTRSSIEHAYKRIILASLADPYHLPFGAIWEIYDQLNDWAEYSQLHEYRLVDNPTGYFVLNLNSDSKPLPYIKFDGNNADAMHRLLDTTPLENLIQQYVERLKMGQPVDSTIRLTPFFAKSLMGHMLKAWGLPPKRYLQRLPKAGQLDLVCGMNPVYFFCNDQKDFIRSLVLDDNEDDFMTEEPDRLKNQASSVFPTEQWQIVDQGAGGYALINNGCPKNPVRVGDLVAIRHPDDDQGYWTLGLIRWLIIGKNKIHKIGIQNLAASARAGAVRACSESNLDREYKRALIISHNGSAADISIITDKGMYVSGRELEMEFDGKRIIMKAKDLLEATVGFEYFKCTPD